LTKGGIRESSQEEGCEAEGTRTQEDGEAQGARTQEGCEAQGARTQEGCEAQGARTQEGCEAQGARTQEDCQEKDDRQEAVVTSRTRRRAPRGPFVAVRPLQVAQGFEALAVGDADR